MAEYSTQDPKIISVFEIIGGYFTDTIFNHIYAGAKTNLKSGSSITDEYVRRLQAYMTGIKNDEKCYSEVIQGVHRYFTRLTRYTTLSFSSFVDRIVGVCVPEKYFQEFSPTDKDELLSSIICDLVSNLIVYAAKPEMLKRIIDEHEKSPSVTIRMLQDTAISSLLAKRALVNNKFMTKAGQAREHVPMDVVEGMKDALRRLVKEKTEALEVATKATERLSRVENLLAEERVKNGKALKMISLLREGPMSRFKPPHETIAEVQPIARDRHPKVPERETIAEYKSSSDKHSKVPERETIAEYKNSGDKKSSRANEQPFSFTPARIENAVSSKDAPKDAGKFQLTNFFKTTPAVINSTPVVNSTPVINSTPSSSNQNLPSNTSVINNTPSVYNNAAYVEPQEEKSVSKKNASIFDDLGNESN